MYSKAKKKTICLSDVFFFFFFFLICLFESAIRV